MENNFCPHCGKSMKEDKSKEEMIDELMESFKNDDDRSGKDNNSKSDKTSNRMEK